MGMRWRCIKELLRERKMKNTKETLGEENIKRRRQKGTKKKRTERKQKDKRIVNNE